MKAHLRAKDNSEDKALQKSMLGVIHSPESRVDSKQVFILSENLLMGS